MVTTAPSSSTRPRATLRWRVVDIVVASVLGVAGGLVMTLWNLVYSPVTAPLEVALPGLQALMYAVWLFPAVLVGLVVRKPGAALYGELVAAAVSALLGGMWGWTALAWGLVQGLGAEIVFAILLYRAWGLLPAILAGMGAGVGLVVMDLTFYYAGTRPEFMVVYAVSAIVSGAVIAGLGSWLLVRGLARTGALARFAAGREAAAPVPAAPVTSAAVEDA
ncbi:ECF transporter S component [Microcella sp.]|uniref:ECF transporter S component n=1 Tax=Microcella sp. TaxID=1913979 RepID=UPI003F70436C